MSVWRGPVPIVHAHGLDLQSLGNNSSLAEHAIACHAENLGEHSTGLHLHLILLDGCAVSLLADSGLADGDVGSSGVIKSGLPHECDTCGYQAFGADNELRCEQMWLAALDARCQWSQLSYGEALDFEARPRFSATADMGFLQTQLSGATACALLCVFLC